MDENVPEECPGTGTEQSGKAAACEGCPNQKICADAGTWLAQFVNHCTEIQIRPLAKYP